MTERALESLLRRERAIIWSALAILTALAWLWVFLGAGTGMSTIAMSTWQFPPPRPSMMMPGDWSLAYWLTMLVMWWVMMIAMMVPSAAPMILLYARVARHGQARGQIPGAVAPTAVFAAGYLVCWLGFSATRHGAAVRTRALRARRWHVDVVDGPLADGRAFSSGPAFISSPRSSRPASPNAGRRPSSWRDTGDRGGAARSNWASCMAPTASDAAGR